MVASNAFAALVPLVLILPQLGFASPVAQGDESSAPTNSKTPTDSASSAASSDSSSAAESNASNSTAIATESATTTTAAASSDSASASATDSATASSGQSINAVAGLAGPTGSAFGLYVDDYNVKVESDDPDGEGHWGCEGQNFFRFAFGGTYTQEVFTAQYYPGEWVPPPEDTAMSWDPFPYTTAAPTLKVACTLKALTIPDKFTPTVSLTMNAPPVATDPPASKRQESEENITNEEYAEVTKAWPTMVDFTCDKLEL